MRSPVLTVLTGLASLALTSACLDNKCDQIDKEPVRYTDGHTNAERTFYQSSTPDEPLLRFPAARKFRMEHGLRETPVEVNVYLSFGATEKKQSLAAGDEALLVLTDEYVEVENNTCADFFLRLTAWTEPLAAANADESAPREPDAVTTDAKAATADAATLGTDAAFDERDR